MIENHHFVLPAMIYENYHVTLNVVRLPQVFCMLPQKRKGYYYQLTATARATSNTQTKPVTACKAQWLYQASTAVTIL